MFLFSNYCSKVPSLKLFSKINWRVWKLVGMQTTDWAKFDFFNSSTAYTIVVPEPRPITEGLVQIMSAIALVAAHFFPRSAVSVDSDLVILLKE